MCCMNETSLHEDSRSTKAFLAAAAAAIITVSAPLAAHAVSGGGGGVPTLVMPLTLDGQDYALRYVYDT